MSVTPSGKRWSGLVVFLTSNRGSYVKRCLPQLARACAAEASLDVLVALDGSDLATRALCNEWRVPLLYSEKQEGVGLSKNRVLERFPCYDYYFFLEDDLELLDGRVFARHVALMNAAGIHHMALFGPGEGRERVGEVVVLGERIVHYRYGSAEFNVFTRTGLERVGGWHPLFAEYRRWGHTEHSHRFPRNGLAPGAFNVAVGLADKCIRHRPTSVTARVDLPATDAAQISLPERKLMEQELSFFPVQTLAPYRCENLPPAQLPALAATLRRWNRYPLLRGSDWRQAQADYLVWRFETSRGLARRLSAILGAAAICPSNISLRHAVKLRALKAAHMLRVDHSSGATSPDTTMRDSIASTTPERR